MLSVSDPYPFDCLNFPAVSPESVNLCHLRFVRISAVHATQMVWHLCCFLFDRNPVVSNIASIIITIPLLVLVIRFVSPYIIRLKYESRTTLLLFSCFRWYTMSWNTRLLSTRICSTRAVQSLLTLWTVFLSYPFYSVCSLA